MNSGKPGVIVSFTLITTISGLRKISKRLFKANIHNSCGTRSGVQPEDNCVKQIENES